MITLLTFTIAGREALLEECLASVSLQTDRRATHLVVNGTKDQIADRRNALKQIDTEYFAMLDDDDTIEPETIELCNLALEEFPGIGAVISEESRMSFDGKIEADNTRPSRRNYTNLMRHPTQFHHICVMRKDQIDFEWAARVHTRFGHGIEWLLAAGAGLRGGAVQIEDRLYNWRRNPTGLTSETHDSYQLVMQGLRNALATVPRKYPQYTPLEIFKRK